jgi:hypothetical protein
MVSQVVTFLRRKIRNIFIAKALESITEAQKFKGVLMKLKGDTTYRRFMPVLVQFPLTTFKRTTARA